MFDSMNAQERMSWIRVAGSLFLSWMMISGFLSLLRVEGGIAMTAPGLLGLSLKVAAFSIVFELAPEILRLTNKDRVAEDERDRDIRKRAAGWSAHSFGFIICAMIFASLPFGFFATYFDMTAVKTPVLGGIMISLFAVCDVIRHGSAIWLHRKG